MLIKNLTFNNYECAYQSDSVPAFVMAGDKVLLSIEPSDAENSAEAILGEVRAVCESTLDLELSLPMKSDAKYTMHFALNRLNFRLEQFAMQNVHDLQLTKYLFPETHPIYLQSDLNFKHVSIFFKYLQECNLKCHDTSSFCLDSTTNNSQMKFNSVGQWKTSSPDSSIRVHISWRDVLDPGKLTLSWRASSSCTMPLRIIASSSAPRPTESLMK